MKLHHRILVVRPDRIGDVVLATPLIRALRTTFPDAYLGAMVRPYAVDVLRENPHLDTIIVDRPGADSLLSKTLELRRHKFNIALHLIPSKRHIWMTFFAGIRRRIGVGDRPYHTLTFMKTISRNNYVPLRHEADYCLDLGRAIGVETGDTHVEVFLTDSERSVAAATLSSLKGTHRVGVVPGSGGSAPNWSPANYAKFARLVLMKEGTSVVVLASGTGVDIAPYQALDKKRVMIITDTSVREDMGLISQIDVLVSSSTGPMHIAAGLGTATTSLFCPLPACSSQLWGPQSGVTRILTPTDQYCATRCPGDPRQCQFEDGIIPENVANAVTS